jgi:hypothetical protein
MGPTDDVQVWHNESKPSSKKSTNADAGKTIIHAFPRRARSNL